ncbi:LacI family DNA-binding transcriptional regulator [Leifsonia sp. NPDC058292]|uniref:LacI family DNA-binding transcriptional regulator n=1 Tax=Leifsonia sp. NPDC058292 TaxID=3346428 RepID=UPI0036DACF46
MTENIEDGAPRRLSIRDIARLAGVSRQTVSRVLNGERYIKPSTEAQVRKVIDDLGWRPNSAARALATSRFKAIGLLVSARSHYGPFSAAAAVDEAARARGYTIISATLAHEDEASLADALDAFLAQGVDGVVVIAPQQRAHEALERVSIGVPSISLQWRDGPGDRAVAFDQRGGARRATRHLIELGHTRILHVAGPQDWNEAEERMRGFLEELSAWDISATAPALGDWTVDQGYDLGLKLLPYREFSAVFASNDQMALGIMHAAADLGLSVPHDLSVVGFDDIPEAKHLNPPLTTVRQDFAQLGASALDLLLAEIEGGLPPEPVEFSTPQLIVRDSTAPYSGP